MKNTIFIAGLVLICATSCKSKKTTTEAETPTATEQSQSTKRGDRPQKDGKKPSATELMTKLDIDGNGMLSKAEAKGHLLEQFSTVDTNNDGSLSLDEVKNAPKPSRQGRKSPRH